MVIGRIRRGSMFFFRAMQSKSLDTFMNMLKYIRVR